jgi:hypothetical protein
MTLDGEYIAAALHKDSNNSSRNNDNNSNTPLALGKSRSQKMNLVWCFVGPLACLGRGLVWGCLYSRICC